MVSIDWVADCIFIFLLGRIYSFLTNKWNMHKNTSGVKKEQPGTKKPCWKSVKLNGQPRPLAYDKYKCFGHDDLTAKHCTQGLNLDVGGIKIFDKDDQATKSCSFHLNVAAWSSWDQNFYPINISPWTPEIATKTFIPIKSRRLWLPIVFTSFSTKPFSTWPLLFYTWVFLFRLINIVLLKCSCN